ncbi:MAG: hypothetical protein SFY67_18345 [Candidatus Melainabacteria bacterium]|nr:hypothetical protein [Candidatus Melainabacteria bacterium]
MDLTHIIPSYQPLPLPAPLWLLNVLLVLGFYLHVLPMNIVMGGTLMAAAMFLKAGPKPDSPMYRSAKELAQTLPVFVSFTITQGIVPLLFLQLLYGPLFYTSSILMAGCWIGIIVLLIVAYYGCYFVIYKLFNEDSQKENGLAIAATLFVSFCLFLLIGFIISSNMHLMLHPEKWAEMYKHSPNGLNFFLGDKQQIPRFLHFFFSSIAMTGLFIGFLGTRKKERDPEQADWMIKKGSLVYSIVSTLQIAIGFHFLFSLPQEIREQFMSGNSLMSYVFISSIALAVISIILGFSASNSGSVKFLKSTMHTAFLVVLTMVISRHFLRNAMAAPFVQPEKLSVEPQWDLLGIFVLSAVGLIVYLVWLVKTVTHNNPTQSHSNS